LLLFHLRPIYSLTRFQAEFLDWLDVYVRDMRECPDSAFGGIQLIFAGDFLQVASYPTAHMFPLTLSIVQLPGVASKAMSIANASSDLRAAAKLASRDGADARDRVENWCERIPVGLQEFCAPAFASQAWRDARFTCVELTTMCAVQRACNCILSMMFNTTSSQLLSIH
jgi:hypothetical protein